MNALLDHLVILPILLPMATGAMLLLFPDRLRRLKMTISGGATLLLLTFAVLLVIRVASNGSPAAVTTSPHDASSASAVRCAMSPRIVIACPRARRAAIRSSIGVRFCASSTTTCP